MMDSLHETSVQNKLKDQSLTTSVSSIILDNSVSPIDPKQNILYQNRSSWYRRFREDPYVKYIKTLLIIIFSLNVVGWGGMLFLIQVGAANKTMPDEHTRKVWLEIDAQILNGLLSIPAIGGIPWRVRDLCFAYIPEYRDKLFYYLPYTTNLRWIRIIVWNYIANSLFHIGVAVCMWSMDMYTRPSLLVGIFIGLGCITGIFAGLTQFILGRKTKKKNQDDAHKF